MTGMRVAMGFAFTTVVAAETINGMPGIGGVVRDAQRFNQTDVVVLGIIVIGVLGVASTGSSGSLTGPCALAREGVIGRASWLAASIPCPIDAQPSRTSLHTNTPDQGVAYDATVQSESPGGGGSSDVALALVAVAAALAALVAADVAATSAAAGQPRHAPHRLPADPQRRSIVAGAGWLEKALPGHEGRSGSSSNPAAT